MTGGPAGPVRRAGVAAVLATRAPGPQPSGSSRLAKILWRGIATALAAAVATDASGQDGRPRVNGVPVDASVPVRLAPKDRLETGDFPIRLKTAQGETRVGSLTAVHHQSVEGGAEYLFVGAGKVEGEIGDRTLLGAAPSWASAPVGAVARVRITSPSPAFDGMRDSATYRATSGGVWLRYHAVAAWLSQGSEVDLATGVAGAASVGFACAAGNRDDFSIARRSDSLDHGAVAPPGVSGFLAERASATRVGCAAAPAGRLLRAESRTAGRVTSTASVGPGAEAVLEGEGVRVEIPALGADAIRRLRDLASEFGSIER